MKDSSRYGQTTHTDFCYILSPLRQPFKNFSIFTTKREINFHQIWWLWLKKWVCQAHFEFQTFLVGNTNAIYLESLNFVLRGFLQRLTPGENLMLMFQTTFENFKIEHFYFSKYPQLCIEQFLKHVFYILVESTLRKKKIQF